MYVCMMAKEVGRRERGKWEGERYGEREITLVETIFCIFTADISLTITHHSLPLCAVCPLEAPLRATTRHQRDKADKYDQCDQCDQCDLRDQFDSEST